MNDRNVQELLFQALETEIGGQEIYRAALSCAQTPGLREEWNEYLEQTAKHEEILLRTFRALNLDPKKETPGRALVRHLGESLVQTIEQARKGDTAAAEIMAAECVTLAETKDHQNWQLIGELGKEAPGKLGRALRQASEEVEDQEAEHLYHTAGWTRELWFDWLGMPSVLPPPEEERSVKTAIGAARAANAREDMLE